MSDIFTWPPEPYILALTGIGVLIALVAWLPLALKKLPLSLPIVCIVIGAALGHYAPTPTVPLPGEHPVFVEHFTELVVIIALMGAGLGLLRMRPGGANGLQASGVAVMKSTGIGPSSAI